MFVFFVVEREEKGNKQFRDAKRFSKKWVAETPIFIVFSGCALFGQVVKKGNVGHPSKKEN